MRKKVLFCANVHSHFNAFHLNYLEWFKKQGFEVHVAANGQEKVSFADKQYNFPIQRHPFKRDNIKAYFALRKLMREERFDIVHCHTPMGGALGRLVAGKYRRKGTRVIYTAHGFHFFKGASLKNWMIYYPMEYLLSKITDILITINHEDYEAAKKIKRSNVYYVPGVGVDIEKIAGIKVDGKEKRAQLGIDEKAVMILSVGELSKRKNHETVIRAIGLLKDLDICYVICGKGSLKEYLKKLGETLDVKVVFLGHRSDVSQILKTADLFVFPSLQEGLPVALMEAMAAGLPIVASRIRGNIDLIEDGVNGYLCDPADVEAFSSAIRGIIENDVYEKEQEYNNISRMGSFDIKNVMTMMEKIYADCIQLIEKFK